MPDDEKDKETALVSLPTWVRSSVTAGVGGLAVAHLIWPRLAIDGVFLGLLGFAALVWFFDFKSIEWLGVHAQRREIQRRERALLKAPPPKPVETPEPPTLVTVHTRPADLNPPTNPRDQFLWAAEHIRIELVVLVSTAGRLNRVAPWSEYTISELVGIAQQTQLVPREHLSAAVAVAQMRKFAVMNQLVDQASELAFSTVQALRSIPRTYNRVRRSHISLFRDRSLSSPFTQTHGIMVVQVKEDGELAQASVYPKEAEYTDGRFLTWEWNMERAFREEAWYADPETREPKLAWSQAATFAGREYPEQWGLEYRLPRPDLGLLT